MSQAGETINESNGLITKEIIRHFLKTRKVKPLTKKQMSELIELMDHREQQKQLKGYEDGKNKIQKQWDYSKQNPLSTQDKSALLMTFQRLGDANAQMTSSLAALLNKLP